MPNIIRRPRSRRPERQYNRACDFSTHITYDERCHIYSLSQYSRWSQRAIASTLQLPRSTVQSAVYAMTGTSRKRQNRKPILTTRAQNHAPAATTSSSAIYTLPAPYMATQMLPDIRQPSLYYLPSAAPTVRSLTMPKPDGYHRQPPQPAVATSGWDTIDSSIEGNVPTNSSHNLSISFSTECYDLYHQFSMHKDTSVGPSLTPNLLKLAPIEPRVIYKSSAYRKFPSRTLLHESMAGTPSHIDSRARTSAIEFKSILR
jgi:hypothetical protein